MKKNILIIVIIGAIYFLPKLKNAPEEAVQMLDGIDSLVIQMDTRKLDSLQRMVIGSDSTISKTVTNIANTITDLRNTIVGLNNKVKLLENEVQTLKKENETLKHELDNIASESNQSFHFFTRKGKDNQ